MQNNDTNQKGNSNQINSDLIDPIYLFKLFKRNKKLTSIFIFLTTLLTMFYVTVAKPTWRGSFNIVVREGDDNFKYGSFGGSDILSNILDSDDGSKTQELILQSPSVLSPVFNYVKDYYIS